MDKALALLRTQYGLDLKCDHFVMEVKTPAGHGSAGAKIAIGWVGDVQYEVIEPVSGLIDLYRDALPAHHALRFHHFGLRTFDFDRMRAEIDRHGRPVALEGTTAGARFVYVDARDSLGHYLEYIWMEPELWAAIGGKDIAGLR